jgi:hypothetical protein
LDGVVPAPTKPATPGKDSQQQHPEEHQIQTPVPPLQLRDTLSQLHEIVRSCHVFSRSVFEAGLILIECSGIPSGGALSREFDATR